jgi:hypothetical protein
MVLTDTEIKKAKPREKAYAWGMAVASTFGSRLLAADFGVGPTGLKAKKS